jgi:hypothetical protein
MPMIKFLLPPRGFALLLAVRCACLGLCSAQTTFERTYSGYEGQAVQQTSDGGYIIAGRAASYDASTTVAYLVKTNPSGDTIWTRRYGRGRWDGGYSVDQTSDGGYIVAGTTVSFEATSSDVFLLKTDASGDTLWTRVYGGPYDDWGYSVQQTSDGGYIVAGYTSSSQGYYKNDAYLIKTNASGDTIWTRTYGGTDIDQAYSVGLTSDGGYIVAGSTHSYDAGREHVYLVRTSATGDTLWTRVYAEGAGRCVEQTSDGGYIIAGYPSLVKTDSTGELLWQRTYPSFVGSEHAFVHQTPSDGGYILVGSKYEWPSGTDLRLVKADAQGDTLWTRTYGGADYEDGNSVQQTSDGGYIIAGTTHSYSATSSEVYLIKTGVDGLVDVPSPLTLATPADGAKGQLTSPTLSWNISQRATSYRLQVAKDPSFIELIINDSALVKTSSSLSGLLNYTRYYWRVKGENQYGSGQYSPVWSFTTVVAVPMLLAPTDEAIDQATTLALLWRTSAGATYYRVQVGVDSTFSDGFFLDDSTLVDTARLVSGLAPGTRYFWHVNAMGTGATSSYSKVWKFETTLVLPTAVTLVAPEDGATVGKDSVQFFWRPSQPGVQRYRWELATDSLFTSPTIDSLLTDTSKVVPTLNGGQAYWWKVAAKNASGWGPFSLSDRFTTLLTGVSETQGIPHEFSLSQNYPNPFNPSARIKYTIGGNRGQGSGVSDVSLIVFDVLGRQVAVLVNEPKLPGQYEVTFDGSALSSGIYLCRLTAGPYVHSMKMLLVK